MSWKSRIINAQWAKGAAVGAGVGRRQTNTYTTTKQSGEDGGRFVSKRKKACSSFSSSYTRVLVALTRARLHLESSARTTAQAQVGYIGLSKIYIYTNIYMHMMM